MRIPEFTRTVLPDRAVGSAAIQVARAPYDQAAEGYAQLQRGVRQTESVAVDYVSREAQAKNATWVNQSVIQYKKDMLDQMDARRTERESKPDGFHKEFDSEMEKNATNFLSNAPSEAARDAFRDSAANVRTSVYGDNQRWERERQVAMFGNSIEKSGQDLSSMAYRAGQRGLPIADLYRDADASAVAGSTFVAPEKVDQIRTTLKETIADSQAAGMVEAQPEEFIKQVSRGRFSGVQGSFEDALMFIQEVEGGFVSNDSGKGPTLYGINSEANPKAYAEMKALYDAGDTKGAQEIAKKTYKEEYWDAIDAGKLSPKMAMVAMDAAVNQGVGATKEMLKKADGDPEKMLALRRERYEQTAKNPAKAGNLKGWLNRLDNLQEEITTPGLSPDKINQYKERAKSAVRVTVMGDMQDIETAAKLGIQVEPSKIDDLIRRSTAVGLHKEAESLQDFKVLQPKTTAFAKESFVAQRTSLQTMKKEIEGGNLSRAKEYSALSTILQNKQEMVQKGDALAYYSAHNIVREPQPIDFGNPENLRHEIDQRRVSAQQIKQLDGLQVSLLGTSEIQSLKQIYESSEPKQMTQVLAGIGQSMTGSEITALSRAVAPTSSTLAVAIAAGNPAVSEKIMYGAKLKGDVKQGDIRDEVNSRLAGVLVDPSKADPIHDSIYAYYKQLSFMAGDTDAAVNIDRLEKAVTDIMGPIVSIDTKTGWGGEAKVLSYKDETTGSWKEEDAINDILFGITDEQLKAVNGGLPVAPAGGVGVSMVEPSMRGLTGKAATNYAKALAAGNPELASRRAGVYNASMIRDNARFVSYGDGVYAAIIDGLGYLADDKGEVYKFDARALEKAQRGRK
jgi:hypothetical protein